MLERISYNIESMKLVIQMTKSKISMCNDETQPLPRQADCQGYYIHCLGGFRAAKVEKDVWMVEPILEDGQPCRKGFLKKAELQALTHKSGLMPIAFQNFGWSEGIYYSSWSPLIPGRTNHLQGPSDLWSNVASNLARRRAGAELKDMKGTTREKVAQLLDDRSEQEWLARSISFSLRSMDISVERIVEFYHEQLVNLMAAGRVNGQRSTNTQDQTLYAQVHSFFLHLGAARDYLGALIAVRIGMNPRKIDCMARLIDALRPRHAGSDAILTLLERRKCVEPVPTNPSRRQMSGWLKEATELRNQFIHRQPYGARHVEGFGHATAISPEMGIYRYVRPVLVDNDSDRDILNVVVSHYRKVTELFQEAAEVSGGDISVLTLTDRDIIAVNFDAKR